MPFGPAFYGFVDSRNPVADRRIAAPAPLTSPNVDDGGSPNSARVLRVRPVYTTLGSAGNRVRLGIVGVLREFSHGGGARTTMAQAGYPYFVMDPAHRFERVTTNRLARVRRLYKVVPNRQAIYRPPQYGQAQVGQVIATTPGG